jgi:hypothetical protein
MTPPDPASLTPSQQAAAAKVVCGCGRPGGVVVLCGPRGVGTSLVLASVAAGLARIGRRILAIDVPLRLDALDDEIQRPDVVLVDDAHLADGRELSAVLDRCRRFAAVVFAGQGRLLTLVARDNRLEEAVTLRATLRSCTAEETAAIVGRVSDGTRFDAAAVAAIHEIAAGIPGAIRRLVELADVVSASREKRSLTAADIEAIHRRLSPLAA